MFRCFLFVLSSSFAPSFLRFFLFSHHFPSCLLHCTLLVHSLFGLSLPPFLLCSLLSVTGLVRKSEVKKWFWREERLYIHAHTTTANGAHLKVAELIRRPCIPRSGSFKDSGSFEGRSDEQRFIMRVKMSARVNRLASTEDCEWADILLRQQKSKQTKTCFRV